MEQERKISLILGASPRAMRYSHAAAIRLLSNGHEIIALGRSEYKMNGWEIVSTLPDFAVDTVTIYLRASRQSEFYEYLDKYTPRRVVFNPGAENPELEKKLRTSGVEVLEACTLVMLSAGMY